MPHWEMCMQRIPMIGMSATRSSPSTVGRQLDSSGESICCLSFWFYLEFHPKVDN